MMKSRSWVDDGNMLNMHFFCKIFTILREYIFFCLIKVHYMYLVYLKVQVSLRLHDIKPFERTCSAAKMRSEVHSC